MKAKNQKINDFICPQTRVTGTYHGVPYSGVVTDSTRWDVNVFIHKVKLDKNILVNGFTRDRIVIDNRLTTINTIDIESPSLLQKIKHNIKKLLAK
jgi:hypothetical protein